MKKFLRIFFITLGVIFLLFIILCVVATFSSNKSDTQKISKLSTETPDILIAPKTEVSPTEPISTETITIPDFCKELQLPLTMTADRLDADGFPYIETWNPDSRICYFSLHDTDSFLSLDTFGSVSFRFTETGDKDVTMVAIDYKENEQTKELYKDWSVNVISNIIGIDIISAGELFSSTQNIGMEIYDHYLLLAELNRENLEYRFTITDMNFAQK